MLQIEVDGIYLDLYENDPPLLTLSVEDLLTTEQTTTYSKTFRIPATPNNNLYFKTAYEINGYDFNITNVRTAKILVNGLLFELGELRLNKIYTTGTGKIDYECIFLGQKKTISSLLGDSALCDLTSDSNNTFGVPSIEHIFNYNNVVTSWNAYPQTPSTTNGLLEGNVLYPLADFGNIYDDSDLLINTRIDAGDTNFTFANPSHPLGYDRFKPSIRAKWVFDKIMSNLGYTYSSEFIDSNLFKKIYISAFGNEANYKLSDVLNSNTGVLVNNNQWIPPIDEGFSEWEYNEVFGNGQNNFTFVGGGQPGGRYTCPENGTYTFSYGIKHKWQILPDADVFLFIRLRKTSGGVTTTIEQDNLVITPDQYIFTQSFDQQYQGVFSAGDEVFVDMSVVIEDVGQYILLGSGIQSGTFFENSQSPGTMAPTSFLNCDVKQIDFVRWMINKFRLMIIPDKSIDNNFIIEPWSEYIGSGDIEDWSDKIDKSKDVVISPLFFTQKKSITFDDKEGNDHLNVDYQDATQKTFGELIVEDPNLLLKDNRDIETKFTPIKTNQVESATDGSVRGFNFTIIPQVHKHDAKPTGGVYHTPIKSDQYSFFYNGLQDTGDDALSTKTFYLRDENSNDYSRDTYPMVSNYSDVPLLPSTLHLTWKRQDPELTFDVLDTKVGGSVYDFYWSEYVNLLYNENSRKVTAYFVLDEETMREFTFDKVIFLEGTYYYIEKIYDYSPNVTSSTKVDLIKLLNYRPIVNPVEPGIIWDNQTDLWNVTTTTWDD